MSSADQNLSKALEQKLPSGKGKTFAIIVSEWNETITHSLKDACIATLLDNEVEKEDIIVFEVPGAFELPSGAKLVNNRHDTDALICIGCVITGETKHDEYISSAVASGIMSLSIGLNKPVVFGLLTPKDNQQAIDRAGGKHGNKGVEAASTALKMLHLKSTLEASKKSIGF